MKAINVSEFDIIKCGVEFVTTAVARPGVEDLLAHMERNESYVYWIQPKGGAIEQQQACICVNGTYYSLNSKLEKAIFRNVRLTRDFQNFERLVDGTRKLVIPQRLFQEKLRTSSRVRRARAPRAARECPRGAPAARRNSATNKTLFTQNVCMMRKSKAKAGKPGAQNAKPARCAAAPAETAPAEAAPAEAAPAEAAPADSCDAPVDAEPSESLRPAAKRSRKSKYNLHVDCVLEGQKRRKFNFESSEILREFSGALSAEDCPLIQTPHTFFRSLCDLFEQEFPNMLSEDAIGAVVSSLDRD